MVKGISIEDLYNGISESRNPNLANIFYRLKYVESFGTDIGRIVESYKEYDKEPLILNTENTFKVTLYNVNYIKENNISNYKIEDLKMFMSEYEKQTNKDINVYKLALKLYEKLEEMKNIENTKIKNELTKTSTLLTDLDKIKSIEKANYQVLYNDLLQQIKTKYLDTNLIDEKAKNYFMEILNDIFNYYLYGNKEIPIEN